MGPKLGPSDVIIKSLVVAHRVPLLKLGDMFFETGNSGGSKAGSLAASGDCKKWSFMVLLSIK